MLVNLAPDRTNVQPHQLRWGTDASIRPRRTDAGEAQHDLIEARVARVHFDEQVRAIVMHRSVDEDDVKEGSEPRPRGARGVEGEFREFAQLRPGRMPEAVQLI